MRIESLHTNLFRPGDDLAEIVSHALQSWLSIHRPDSRLDGCILAVTSKVVSLCENQIVPKASVTKAELIRRQADVDLGEIGYGSRLTVKENLLLASAGIDESNSESNDFICLPLNPTESAKNLWHELKDRFHFHQFGIILTDSRTSPLRLGTTGVSLSHYGFHGLADRIGQPDLFGKPLQMTKVNLVDALAASAVLVMGEANEQTPLALISEIPRSLMSFFPGTDVSQLRVPEENGTFPSDLYWPFLEPGFKR